MQNVSVCRFGGGIKYGREKITFLVGIMNKNGGSRAQYCPSLLLYSTSHSIYSSTSQWLLEKIQLRSFRVAVDIVQHMQNSTCVTKKRQQNKPGSIQPSEFFYRGFVETTVGAAAVC